jgi:ABC-type transporter Mla subunit MlaD
MSKRAPSTTQLLVIAGFALSCFGILLFLWITFGGPTPFKARPYEINVPFKEATQLAQQSDVRISGVSVGKVQDIVLAPNGKDAMAKVDIDDKYGPLPANTRAILRTKTLLGETYIELTPGSRKGPRLARSPNRSSSTRSSAPSTPKPALPSRPGSRKPRSRSRARAPASPTPSVSSNQPSPVSITSSACSTASGSRSSSSSATAPLR